MTQILNCWTPFLCVRVCVGGGWVLQGVWWGRTGVEEAYSFCFAHAPLSSKAFRVLLHAPLSSNAFRAPTNTLHPKKKKPIHNWMHAFEC